MYLFTESAILFANTLCKVKVSSTVPISLPFRRRVISAFTITGPISYSLDAKCMSALATDMTTHLPVACTVCTSRWNSVHVGTVSCIVLKSVNHGNNSTPFIVFNSKRSSSQFLTEACFCDYTLFLDITCFSSTYRECNYTLTVKLSFLGFLTM